MHVRSSGVSLDSPRVQTCGSGEKIENGGGRRDKKSEILGGPAEGGSAESSPWRGRVKKTKKRKKKRTE